MDRETRFEILKIIGMVVILVALIWGIVWLNSNHEDNNLNTINTTTNENATIEENNTENVDSQENTTENTENDKNEDNKTEKE